MRGENKFWLRIKELLWKLGIIHNCPKCGNKLTEYGYGEFGGHYVRCDRCHWGERK